jgi:hypothetical protein
MIPRYRCFNTMTCGWQAESNASLDLDPVSDREINGAG